MLFAIPTHKPLYLDNMDFPAVARATAETGIPVYYRGEENPRHSGLYHPPLYIYLLAGWFRAWGFGETQARLFGFACLFLHGWILLRGVRALFGSGFAQACAPVFWALFLLHPYTLQGAAVLDIDTSIYGPLLAALVVSALELNWRNGSWRTDPVALREWLAISLLTALALWAKLTTALSVLPLAAVLPARRIGWRKALLAGGLSVAAGALLFLASYGAYGAITGLDIAYTFRFLAFSLHQRSGPATGLEWLAAHWRTLRDMIHWQLLWTGLLPWLVAAATLVWAWLRRGGEEGRRARDAALPVAWALAVTVFYCWLTYSFGRAPFKYAFVAWGVVCAALAAWQTAAWIRLQEHAGLRAARATAWLTGAVFFLLVGKWLRDRAILEGATTRADLAVLVLPALLGLAGLLAWRRTAGALCFHHGTLAYAGAMLGLALAMARAPYPTTYDYGQEGFDDTVCFLRHHTAPEEAIISMKDVGFRAGRRYFENYIYVFGGPEWTARMRQLLLEGRARYAVFTRGNGPDDLVHNPALAEVIGSLCTLSRQYGHYRIYDCSGAAQRAAAP